MVVQRFSYVSVFVFLITLLGISSIYTGSDWLDQTREDVLQAHLAIEAACDLPEEEAYNKIVAIIDETKFVNTISALNVTIRLGSKELVERLLIRELQDFKYKDGTADEQKALHLRLASQLFSTAVSYGHAPLITLFIRSGLELLPQGLSDVLFRAAIQGYEKIVDALFPLVRSRPLIATGFVKLLRQWSCKLAQSDGTVSSWTDHNLIKTVVTKMMMLRPDPVEVVPFIIEMIEQKDQEALTTLFTMYPRDARSTSLALLRFVWEGNHSPILQKQLATLIEEIKAKRERFEVFAGVLMLAIYKQDEKMISIILKGLLDIPAATFSRDQMGRVLMFAFACDDKLVQTIYDALKERGCEQEVSTQMLHGALRTSAESDIIWKILSYNPSVNSLSAVIRSMVHRSDCDGITHLLDKYGNNNLDMTLSLLQALWKEGKDDTLEQLFEEIKQTALADNIARRSISAVLPEGLAFACLKQDTSLFDYIWDQLAGGMLSWHQLDQSAERCLYIAAKRQVEGLIRSIMERYGAAERIEALDRLLLSVLIKLVYENEAGAVRQILDCGITPEIVQTAISRIRFQNDNDAAKILKEYIVID